MIVSKRTSSSVLIAKPRPSSMYRNGTRRKKRKPASLTDFITNFAICVTPRGWESSQNYFTVKCNNKTIVERKKNQQRQEAVFFSSNQLNKALKLYDFCAGEWVTAAWPSTGKKCVGHSLSQTHKSLTFGTKSRGQKNATKNCTSELEFVTVVSGTILFIQLTWTDHN